MLARIKDYSKLPAIPQIKPVAGQTDKTDKTDQALKKKRKPTMKDIHKLFRKLGVHEDKKDSIDINAFLKTVK